jgi:hypothetical protein
MSQSLLFSLAIKTIIHHEGRGTHEDFSGFLATPVSALLRDAAGLFLPGENSGARL